MERSQKKRKTAGKKTSATMRYPPMRPPGIRAAGTHSSQNRREAGEVGFVDVAFATYACTVSAGTVTMLNVVPVGAGIQQRVGKKIMLKSIQLRGELVNKTSATTNDVAYCIVYDKKPGAAAPAITDIFNTDSVHSFNNTENSDRFRILRRVDATLVGGDTTGRVANTILQVDEYISLKGYTTTYKSNSSTGTGAVGDVSEGALWLVTLGNNVAAGNLNANLNVGCRLRFYE